MVSDKRVVMGTNVLLEAPPRAFVTVGSAGMHADLEPNQSEVDLIWCWKKEIIQIPQR